jgi:hypothetical protein
MVHLEELRRFIKPYVIGDDHIHIGETNEYTVRSIYFDTHHLDEYHKKLAGIYRRRKVRVRGYDFKREDSLVFLEIKRKINMSISKNRAPLLYRNLDHLLSTGNLKYVQIRGDFPESADNASKFLFHYFRFHLKPVVLVMYEREAFINKFDHSERITFDKYLRSRSYPKIDDLFSNDNVKHTLTKQFILEVKSNKGFPAWMTPIVNRFELKREALSKYTMSIDTHTSFPNNFSKSNVICFSNGTNAYNFSP